MVSCLLFQSYILISQTIIPKHPTQNNLQLTHRNTQLISILPSLFLTRVHKKNSDSQILFFLQQNIQKHQIMGPLHKQLHIPNLHQLILFPSPIHLTAKPSIRILHHVGGLFIIIGRMATDRNKIVENYVLQDFKYCNSDQSQIWIAKHRILKKNFTLKRIKYPTSQSETSTGPYSNAARDEWNYQNVLRETNILKRLMCEVVPKCHKMIKTSNNLYVVYDQFPPATISEYLTIHHPSRQEKLVIMLAVAKGLSVLHTRSVLLLNLSVYNVFLKDKNSVFFGDWSMARTIETQEKVDCSFLTGSNSYLAKELVQEGRWTQFSDVYSLGCLFQKVLRSGLLEEPQQIQKKLEQLVSKMTSPKPQDRPRLDDILKKLQQLSPDQPTEMVDSPRGSGKGFVSQRNIGSFRIKHTTSTPADMQDCSFQQTRKYTAYLETPKMFKEETSSINASKSVKSAKSDSKKTDALTVSSRKIETQKSFELSSPLLMSYSRRKKEEDKPTALSLIKITNKKRNLAFFLLQLAQFVLKMSVCPELGYILLKYSLLTITSATQEWQRQQHFEPKEKDDVTAIMMSEKLSISTSLASLKENMGGCLNDMQTRREVEMDSQISDRFLKEKIIEFSKEMVVYCEESLSDKASQKMLVECLFKTYMILKKIEEGTYQKFWEKIYQNDYAFLHSQKYLKDQRQLGHRYLKSRIAQILRGK